MRSAERRRRGWSVAPLVAAALLLSAAGAHATLVLGELVLDPDPPAVGAPSGVTVTLRDPSGTPIQDARIQLDVRPADQPDATATVVPLREQASPEGSYRGGWTPSVAGAVTALVRDQTYRQEEARANVNLVVGGDANGTVPFVLPPTATGPRSIATWLVWLIGLPVAAGVLVTVLVLRGGRRPGGPEAGQDA